ncbi:hypothetical protein HanIR_Chr06g0282511 [Helianthus annuus]|nr:hypothetical protein HanIR_Chr06g0282511 [Helianthus annuus]
MQNIKGVVGDGKNIKMWTDPWLWNIPLKDRCPNLFKLEKHKKCMVTDRYNFSNRCFMGRWEWYRLPSSEAELDEWHECIDALDSITLTSRSDKWEWIGGKDSDFSVGAVKRFMLSDIDFSNNFVFIWPKWIPKKCNILVWRAATGRIRRWMRWREGIVITVMTRAFFAARASICRSPVLRLLRCCCPMEPVIDIMQGQTYFCIFNEGSAGAARVFRVGFAC